MTLPMPASRTAASKGKSCSSRSSRGPTWAGAWLSPPSASPWPTMCLAVASTPGPRASAPGAPRRRRSPSRPRGTDPRRTSPRCGPSAGRGRCRARAPARGARRSPASAGWIVAGYPLHERRIERGRGADGLLEARRAAGEQAVEALLVDDRRDAQARLLDQVALDLVGLLAPRRRAAGSWTPRAA